MYYFLAMMIFETQNLTLGTSSLVALTNNGIMSLVIASLGVRCITAAKELRQAIL